MATTGQLIEWLAGGVVTSAGAFLASGKVRFYQVATLTPISVTSDDALAIPITQPVTLNAGGSALVYVGTSCRMIIKDATDTTSLFDVTLDVTRADQIYVTSSAFNGGAETQLSTILNGWTTSAGGSSGLWKYKRSATSVERNIRDAISDGVISVKDRGATGDGATNDTAALAAAVAEISALGGGQVKLPAGNYLIDASGGVLTLPAKVSLIGAGSASTTITLNHATANAVNVSAAGVGNNTIQGITITNTGTSTGTAIFGTATTGITIRDVIVTTAKFKFGVNFSACSSTAIYDSTIGGNDTGVGTGRCLLYSTSGINHNVFNASLIISGTGTCIECSTGASTIGVFGSAFSGGTGVLLTSSDNNDYMRVIGCTGLANNVTTPFSEVAPASRMLFQTGNLIDGYETTVTSGATVIPSPILRGSYIRIQGTTTGAAYNVSVPPTAPTGRAFIMVIEFFNNSGGAVTGWTMAAGYHMSAAVPTADLAKTEITFRYDQAAAVWRDIGRAQTT